MSDIDRFRAFSSALPRLDGAHAVRAGPLAEGFGFLLEEPLYLGCELVLLDCCGTDSQPSTAKAFGAAAILGRLSQKLETFKHQANTALKHKPKLSATSSSGLLPYQPSCVFLPCARTTKRNSTNLW